MYVAVKGGEKAIENSHKLIAEERRGDLSVPELTVTQIREQMALAVDRVMSEGALYDPDLAALALKQAQGDVTEAAFLIRAYRTTLEIFGKSEPFDTASMHIRRRVSAAYKDLPGGQVLGPTYDYTHRLLDFDLEDEQNEEAYQAAQSEHKLDDSMPRVTDIVGNEGLMEQEVPPEADPDPIDLTHTPLKFPAERDVRLQNLARGDEGFLLGMAYSTQRGFGGNHPFAGEIRMGDVPCEMMAPELGFVIDIGDVKLTECQMINQFKGSEELPPQFTRGYALTFGHTERKAMSVALVDRALRGQELGEEMKYPAQDAEFVLYHSDSIEASGFVQHLKLPHYVDFQGELHMLRKMRDDFFAEREAAAKLAAEENEIDAPLKTNDIIKPTEAAE